MSYKPGQMWRHKPGEPVKTVMLVEVRRGATQTHIIVDTVDGKRIIREDKFLHEFELGWDVDDTPRTTWDRLLVTEEEF